MNRLLRVLIRILALTTLWAAGGYALGVAIEATIELNYPVGIILASLNVILGLSLFLGITHDPTAERIFFEGPRRDEAGRPAIGCLWGLPFGLLVFGLLMWLVAIFMRLIFPN